MTYCVAVSVDAGIVFCSDSLTNAGIDQVSTYSKKFHFGIDGERQFVILCAGNLATTQATMATVKSDIKKGADVNLLKHRYTRRGGGLHRRYFERTAGKAHDRRQEI